MQDQPVPGWGSDWAAPERHGQRTVRSVRLRHTRLPGFLQIAHRRWLANPCHFFGIPQLE